MNIIKDTKENIIEVKNSKFITKIFYIETENEAIDIIKNIKKIYFDARHNCYAYKIGYKNQIIKQSDDGEPKGTAGIPILNAIDKNDLTNCLIIVTRYFGGVLLGASLLLRTYQDSALAVANNSEKSVFIEGKNLDISFEYTYYNSILNYLTNNSDRVVIANNKFEDNVNINIYISNDIIESFIETIKNITKANAKIVINNNINFAKFKNEVRIIKNYE